MTYEATGLNQKLQDHLNALADAAAYKRLNSVHSEYVAHGTINGEDATPQRTIYTEARPKNATGLLATDWALDDYNTWK